MQTAMICVLRSELGSLSAYQSPAPEKTPVIGPFFAAEPVTKSEKEPVAAERQSCQAPGIPGFNA